MHSVRTGGGLLAEMVRLANAVAGTAGGELTMLSHRSGGGAVIRVGAVVVKAHPRGDDPATLAARLRLATDAALVPVLVPPLAIPGGPVLGVDRLSADRLGTDALGTGGLGGDRLSADRLNGWAARIDGRLVTAWPAGEPVPIDDPDAAPWEDGARLLARLHGTPAPSRNGLPPHGGPARVERALARARAVGGSAAAVVERAYETVPAVTAGPRTLVHGDWHLGQLVRGAGGDPGWRLVDVDDLGTGDPVWDLARPAALFAAGVLDPQAWHRFLGAYCWAGGAALPADRDPWTVLDAPARALAVQLAAGGVATAADEGRPLDEFEIALLDACRRMATVGGPADVS